MAFSKWLSPDTDGLSKKRDSPRMHPSNPPSIRLPWNGIRRRRVIFTIVALVAIFVFVRNIPSDVVPVGQRYHPLYGSMASGHTQHQLGQNHNEQHPHRKGAGKVHDEPVRFQHLASTLRTFANVGFKASVLFALLNPSSAAHILPLACQMRQNDMNFVHVALMGRSVVSSDDLMKVNGLLPEDCQVVWHDARTDFAMESSERRIVTSIQQAFYYLHRGLAPSVVIVDDAPTSIEHQLSMLERTASKTNTPVLRLPPATSRSMPWLTLLEGSALAHLAEVEIDIMVQGYSESSGSLIRLLRSLKNANYVGIRAPHLTIELPSHTDPSIVSFLSRFKWPPAGSSGKASQITIRRRVDLSRITPLQASIQTIESFYPAANPSNHHLLVLSPDIELSAGFMHYLLFSILHFRHGQSSVTHSGRLFGISLDLPENNIDGTKPFLSTASPVTSPFMLSQTPNSRAALYFGDKWMEFHTFLSNRLVHDTQLSKGTTKVSKPNPQWIKHALEMMQARSLYMLYPAFARDPKQQIAVLHQDLQHIPEELMDSTNEVVPSSSSSDRTWLTNSDVLGEEALSLPLHTEQAASAADMTLPSVLIGNHTSPNQDVISPLSLMSPYSASGEVVEWFETDEIASKYADEFSLRLGGCDSLQSRNVDKAGTVEYLFCDPG